MDIVETKTGNIPEQDIRLEEINGMESSKRALEVALAGQHAIVFVRNAHSQAIELVKAGFRIGEKLGLAFHGLAYPVCKCGYYGSAGCECKCSVSTIRKHLTNLGNRREEFDIWIDSCPQRAPVMADGPTQTEEVFIDDILKAKESRESIKDADSDGIAFLREYQKHTGRLITTDTVLSIGRSIASLDRKATHITTEHIAEALCYHASAIYWVWEAIEARTFEARTPTEQSERRK